MTLPSHGPVTASAREGAAGVFGLYEDYGRLIGHDYRVQVAGEPRVASRFSNISLPGACATRFEGSALDVEMSANRNGLDLVILSFPTSRQALCYGQRARTCLAEGEGAILHTTDAALRARSTESGTVLAVALPRPRLAALVANPDSLTLRALPRSPALGLFLSHASTFLDLGQAPGQPLAGLIGDQLCDLAALALDAGRTGRDSAAHSHAVGDARFNRAMRFIDHHLGEPGLSERDIARYLGLSPSSVRQLFAAKHSSPAKAIRLRRAELAARMLRETGQPGRKIVTIAFECGFRSLSAFYEAFRDAHGMHPSDYRALAEAAAD